MAKNKRERAYEIAFQEINEHEDQLSFIEKNCHELPYGWIFAFNTREAIESNNPNLGLMWPPLMIVDLELDEIVLIPDNKPLWINLFIYGWKRRIYKIYLFLKKL